MTATCFVDTNVFVYSVDTSEPAKQKVARHWLDLLWSSRAGRTSVQVLSEYFVTVTRKLRPGISPEVAWGDVGDWFAWKPTSLDIALLAEARRIQQTVQLSWWDALIVAAAQIADCRYLLTEDLQGGRDIEGLTIINPFHTSPDQILSPN